VLKPTPAEVAAVVTYARGHPWLGYKRLAWAMINDDVAYLRPGLVYDILAEHDLLGRRAPAPAAPVRPAEADHPDRRRHTDLMSVRIRGRWFWPIDVLDAYSRYLVSWEILLYAKADAVTLAVQRALETLDHPRLPGEPEIVHDRGSQFVSREWRVFVQASGMTDVRTRGHHPQSNGRLERLHRTTREEGLTDEEQADLYAAEEQMMRWQQYYNHERPRSAPGYLRPVDYYRGNPEARRAEREAKLRQAAAARAAYWRPG
jgi:transposase InsO family protein